MKRRPQSAIQHSGHLHLAIFIGCLVLLPACNMVGGAFNKQPEDIDQLSSGATALIETAYQGIDLEKLTDYHTHLVGLNNPQNGTFVNASWQSPLNIVGYIRFITYKSASGITDLDQADQQFVERLTRLITHLPHRGKFALLAFDYFHNEQGQPDKTLSTFHVPNHYMMNIVKQYPDYFFPVISIHPYREDAISELNKYAAQGVRYIKWLPNAMGIHPAASKPALSKKLSRYYQTLAQHDMVLISHTGDEHAVEVKDIQHYGNPWHLQKPLSMGVTVVMAHVASLGACRKIDPPPCKPGIPYSDIAIAMLRDARYDNQLYADISGTTLFNRDDFLGKMLGTSDIHHKLIDGSDYPLPAINFLIQTRALEQADYITSEERRYLNEIYHVNPLLFDFVLKRTIKHPKTGQKLPAAIFARQLSG